MAQIRAAAPGLEGWLQRAFIVMERFMADAGVLTVALSRPPSGLPSRF